MDIFYPVKLFADWLTCGILALSAGTPAAAAVDFFIYDTVKIFILLAVIIYAVSIIRTYLPPEKTRQFLSRKKQWTGNILAALIGIITPFCTCSAIPLFLGFVEAGVPLGVTFTFLVASPMINEVAVVMLLGMFGWKIALLYIFSGILIAVFSGLLIGKMNVSALVVDFAKKKGDKGVNAMAVKSRKERMRYAGSYTLEIIKKVWLFVVIGVGLGAWIHGYVPVDFLARYGGSGQWYAVPLATIIGIPLYSNAAGVVPLVSVLAEKGMSMGTVLAFMMAVTALSLPEFLILRRVMKTKLILIYAGVVGAGIIFTGYIFNLVLG